MRQAKRLWAALCPTLITVLLGGCLGGAPDAKKSFDAPLEGLTQAQRGAFILGDAAFNRMFTAETGLGPVFNAPSCSSCHVRDGRGHPAFRVTRFGLGDPTSAASFDYLLDLGGPQLQNRAIVGYLPESLPDLPGVVTSSRIAPQLAGLGLIEAIDDTEILSRADPDDLDGDGISGRPNYVVPPPFFVANPTNSTTFDGRYLGRFGWKATGINLVQQVALDYHDNIGITSDRLPTDLTNPIVGPTGGDPAPDPEISAATVQNVAFYLSVLRPPSRRDETDAEVVQGEGLFTQLGCASCHVPELRTSKKAAIELLRDKPVPLYSDLLLHDMGPDLADNYPEGDATGREFRTPPLWGLGIIKSTQGGRAFYLHDGRTSDLREVIKVHGGEAERSRTAFFELSETEKDALIAFLKSL
ncbi:MAG: c-type cytochrome [Myxococcales bacterium]|nr:c-type cytochrome [Myxococcales bacterium]